MSVDLGLTAMRAMRQANPRLFRQMWERDQVMPAVREICAKARTDHNLIPVEETNAWKAREELAAEQVRIAAVELVSQETDPVTTAFPPAG